MNELEGFAYRNRLPMPPPRAEQTEVLLLILEEQRQTNQLLTLLIDVLSEAEGDPDAEPTTYMDGTPIRSTL